MQTQLLCGNCFSTNILQQVSALVDPKRPSVRKIDRRSLKWDDTYFCKDCKTDCHAVRITEKNLDSLRLSLKNGYTVGAMTITTTNKNTDSRIPQTFMGYPANAGDAKSVREMLALHDMDYQVEKVPAQYEYQGNTRDTDQFHLVRTDSGDCLSDVTVKSTYRPLTPGDIADDFQWFVDSGYADPFAAFSTANGQENVVLVLKPDLFGEINGYTGFLIGQNRQGNAGARGSLFVYRQVCSNGMMGWSRDGSFSISHRGNVRQKFTDHTREWTRISEAFQRMNQRMTELTQVPMTWEQFVEAADRLHGTITEGDTVLDAKTREEASTRKRNIRERTLAGVNMPEMGTYGRSAADFYNAVTWRLSHNPEGSQRSMTALTDSLLVGAALKEERSALEIAGSYA